MFYITGDMHGEQSRFYDLAYNHNETLWSHNDYLFICGDWGFLFFNNRSENAFLDDLSSRPYTICFLDGNHENFQALAEYPEELWNGGRIHRIRKNIIHLMRGQYYTIQGKTFFTMGGAYSIDRYRRKLNESYWPEELPNNEEYKEAASNLKAHGFNVDYILTHTAPREIMLRMGITPDAHDAELTGFLEWVYYETSFQHWFFGHLHRDQIISENMSAVWFDLHELG